MQYMNNKSKPPTDGPSQRPFCLRSSKTSGNTERWRGHRHSVLFSVLRSVFTDRARSNMLEELFIYTALALALRSKAEKKRTRSKWAKAWLLKRNNLSHINWLKDLTLEPGDWYNLPHLVAPHIRKNGSVRDAQSHHMNDSASHVVS
jgi:hypothetical protein